MWGHTHSSLGAYMIIMAHAKEWHRFSSQISCKQWLLLSRTRMQYATSSGFAFSDLHWCSYQHQRPSKRCFRGAWKLEWLLACDCICAFRWQGWKNGFVAKLQCAAFYQPKTLNPMWQTSTTFQIRQSWSYQYKWIMKLTFVRRYMRGHHDFSSQTWHMT